MTTHKQIKTFKQISISEAAREMIIQNLLGDSTRKLLATNPSARSKLKQDVLATFFEESQS
jgi:hypothetical protein